MKVMTILGTRPEIIRLSLIIKLLDQYADHILVHTGQNHDDRLSEIFFSELGIRRPDVFLGMTACQDVRATLDRFRSLSDLTNRHIRHSENAGLFLHGPGIREETKGRLLQPHEIE